LNRAGASGAVALAVVLAVTVLLASDPPSSQASYSCAGSPNGPFDIQTYEAANWRTTYGRTFELAAFNRLFPDVSGFELPRLETGPRSAGSGQLGDSYIPPTLLKAIAWIESGWAQADWSVPYGGIGPPLTSSSCAYGIMQVLSGMENTTGVPNLEQSMIGGHYAFNIARGARILADKWNYAPTYRPIVGSRNPHIIEDWYYAVWSYYGFSFKSHPLNPDYPASRSAYRCDGTQPRSNYPYQELVFGCIANPPVVDGVRLWDPLPVKLPSLSDPAFSLQAWDACSGSFDCDDMDLARPSPSHTDPTSTGLTRAQVIGSPGLSVSRTSVELSAVHGDVSQPISLTIANPGSGVLAFHVAPSSSWLKLSRRQGVSLGSDLGSRNFTLTVRAAATNISAGTHTASIKVESLYPSATKVVNVSFRVFDLPDGTLLRGSAPDVFVMRKGLKRHVVSLENFIAHGFSSSDVRRVTDSFLATIPTGQPLLDALADGNLLKGSAADVWVMEGGEKRHAVNAETFLGCGYFADAILTVPDSLLGSTPTGPPLDEGSCPRLTFDDGTLLRGSAPDVYVMEGGEKRYAVSVEVFLSCGYRGGNVNTIADSTLEAIPDGPPLSGCAPEGTLLRGSAPDVFVMQKGLKRHVVSLENFIAHGFSSSDVQRVTDSFLATIPTGQPLLDALADGNLLKGSAADVWVMEGGEKRHAVNAETFLGCGYFWDAILTVPDSLLSSTPTGPPLDESSCPRLTFDDGTLLRGSAPDVYVMEGGKKRHAVSVEVFLSCGYTGGNVNTIADSTLGAIPDGPPLSGCAPEGALLRGSAPDVFVMRKGLKRHVVSLENFIAHWFSSSDVQRVTDSFLATIPTGQPLLDALADGNLLKGSAADVWVMEGGEKRHAVNAETFLGCGYFWDAILTVPDSLLSSTPTGPPLDEGSCPRLTFDDGTLLRGSAPDVYVMEGGEKRYAVSVEVFLSCRYKGGNVNSIANSTLGAIPTGDDLTVGSCP
jgi:hypothetical protein